MSKTHNKERIPLLYLLISCISARPESQVLSIKNECTFRFSNFLLTDLCNSSANCRIGSETLATRVTQAKSEERWSGLFSL